MDEILLINEGLRVGLDVDYNEFFHPNVCHVCKWTNQNLLTYCDRCYMISYCSEDHKMQDKPYHADLCAIIADFQNDDPRFFNRSYSDKNWMRTREELIRKVRVLLERELRPHEVQMFMNPRKCFECHQRIVHVVCPKCLSVSYCLSHKHKFNSHLETECTFFAISLIIDIKFLEQSVWESVRVDFSTFPDKRKHFNDIESFCNQYYSKKKEHTNWDINKLVFSDYVSDPLTVYNGLQSAKLFYPEKITGTFVIHIISATDIERRYFPAWELFLHFLSAKTKLVIVMLGLELQHEIKEHNICSCCEEAEKRLIFESFPLLYHNYMYSTKYRRPNVIVGFQARFHYGKTWSESIRAIQSQNCPLLLTAILENITEDNVTEIRRVLGDSVTPVLHVDCKNKFTSCRPYREVFGSLMFRNSQLIIYKNLNH
ncbi:PREDICTED: uncharacterized protein LOC106744660 [Dinoponera quadriceps]|uniref:Uncharacterized protein LOC106744660 n=1 Tax=Dinoponera quadriceps TaxID=609295 RepID=A0A6P3X9U7_DINQU|nr:PREDICTED: uncharacterized protein LOC106744660 [Dinoponera quadriceps]